MFSKANLNSSILVYDWHIFKCQTLLEDKTIIVAVGESQPRLLKNVYALEDFTM